MEIYDFSRSFIHGKMPANSVRFWVESVTRIIDEADGTAEDYFQCGACKSENTFAETDLLKEDNYDFTPVFGPEFSVIFRRRAAASPEYRRVSQSSELWAGQTYRLREAGARRLDTNSEIRAATHDGAPLVSCTEVANPDRRLRAIIQCPIKTMNIHDGRDLYQVDTGPVVLPDLSRKPQRSADTLSLAFLVFNAPGFADFVIEDVTEVPAVTGGTGSAPTATARIHHYSRIMSLPARNTLWALE